MRRRLLHNVPRRTGTFIHADNRFWQRARHRRRRRRRGIAFFFAVLPPACETGGRADAIVATHGGNLLESPIVLPNGCTAPRRIESSRAFLGRFYCRDFFAALLGDLANDCPRCFMASPAFLSEHCTLAKFGRDVAEWNHVTNETKR